MNKISLINILLEFKRDKFNSLDYQFKNSRDFSNPLKRTKSDLIKIITYYNIPFN